MSATTPITTITIGNIRREDADGKTRVYIGRPSALGNPFAIGRDGDRDDVIAKYAAWLDQQLADPQSPAARKFARLQRTLAREGRLHLLCWCAPQRCHCEVIRDRLLAVQP